MTVSLGTLIHEGVRVRPWLGVVAWFLIATCRRGNGQSNWSRSFEGAEGDEITLVPQQFLSQSRVRLLARTNVSLEILRSGLHS